MTKSLNAPTRVAALIALRDAIEAEIKADKLEAIAFAGEYGIKSYATPFGPVNVVTKDAAIGWDADALLTWVAEHYPSEVETIRRVRPAFQPVLATWLVVAGGDVVNTVTGETIDFAYVIPAGEPYVSWPSSAKQRDAKATARRVVQERALGWAKSILPAIESKAAGEK
jgi:hypothetical protein